MNNLAWLIADRYPGRLASLTILSRPHPAAFVRALAMPDGEQARRSKHHRAFLEPDAADVVLAEDCKWLRDRLAANGMPEAAIERHLTVLGNKDAMEAALAWYRARGAIRGPLGPIRVPTLYIWGDADDTVGRVAAEGTVDFIAAPYRFEVLPGVGHFAADQAPEPQALRIAGPPWTRPSPASPAARRRRCVSSSCSIIQVPSGPPRRRVSSAFSRRAPGAKG